MLSLRGFGSLLSFRVVQWAGLVTGVVVGGLAGEELGLDPNRVIIVMLLLVSTGIIGAHGLYALAAGARTVRELRRLSRERSASLWGLPLPLVLAPVVVGAAGLSLLRFADSAAAGLLTATAIGRMACAHRGCCCGRPSQSRLAVSLPDATGARAARLPVQLVDSSLAAILALACLIAAPRLSAGTCFFSAAAVYAATRFVTDWARAGRPQPPAISTTQAALIAVCLISTAGVVLS